MTNLFLEEKGLPLGDASQLFLVKQRLHMQSVSKVYVYHRNKNGLLIRGCSQFKCLASTFFIWLSMSGLLLCFDLLQN